RWGLVAGQDLVHRGGVEVQPVAAPVRPPPRRDPQAQDPPLGAPVQLVGAAARPAGPVAHPSLAVGAVPVRPSLGGRYRHAIPVSRPAQRPPLINDAPRQTQPAGRSQRSITVRHETSRCSEPSSSYTSPGGLTYVQHPTACHQPPWSVQLIWSGVLSRGMVRRPSRFLPVAGASCFAAGWCW